MSLIEIENLSVTFQAKGRHVRAVEGVSLKVNERESYGLVGESGSGKSTILRAICGLAPVTGGTIRIGGEPIPNPDLLIADEPTSALDVTVQAEVLAILDNLVKTRGMGLIFISHDLRLVARFCDRVLVMYKGRIVEELAAKDLMNAKHPYTQGLLNCLPRIGGNREPLPGLDRNAEWAR